MPILDADDGDGRRRARTRQFVIRVTQEERDEWRALVSRRWAPEVPIASAIRYFMRQEALRQQGEGQKDDRPRQSKPSRPDRKKRRGRS